MPLSFRGVAIGCAMLGIVLIAAGGALIPIFKKIVHTTIEQSVAITPTSATFAAWKESPVPVSMQFFFFTVVNPEEVLSGGKPNVVQKGPYTYRKYQLKENITWYENHTVSYYERCWYVFDRNMSVGGEEDVIVSINVPLVTTATLFKDLPWIVQILINAALAALGDSQLLLKHTVGEWLWGYENPLVHTVGEILAGVGISFPVDFQFGYLHGKNNTNDGPYVVYTGEDDPSMTAEIDRWKGMHDLPYWTTKSSNMINGTDGTMFGPSITRDQTLDVFSSEVCRSMYLVYDRDTSTFGIDLYRFVLPPAVFQSSTVNPANVGFCATDCLGSGVLDVSRCHQGAPIIVSQPHFLNGDPKYIDAVQGMHPTDELNAYVEVEPMTGVAFNGAKKMQINVHVQPSSAFGDLKNVRSVIFPVLFVNESAFVDERNAKDFKDLVPSKIRLTYAVQYGLMALGGVILLATALVSLIHCSAKSEEKMPIKTPLLSKSK